MFPKFLIPVLLLAGQTSFAQETSKLVKVSGEMVGVEQCIQPLDDGRRQVLSKLSIRLRITNVSTRTLIIYRYYPAVFDARLSLTLADIDAAKLAFVERPAFRIPPPPRKFDEAAPTREFRVLQRNDTFTYEAVDGVTFVDTESIPPHAKRLEGDYFIQFKAATWFWETEKAERLKQRWAAYGDLFYSDITIQPFSITINKPAATIAPCNTL